MIDLHSHILPGLDDGARDMADSIAMARQAEADGIGVVCATPHIRSDHDVRIAEIAPRVESLNRALADAAVSTWVTTGGEVAEPIAAHLSADELRAVSLGGGGRWILLEPDAGPLGQALVRTVERLGARGFRSLVAHPERHFDDLSIDALIAATRHGALVQVTAATLVDSEPDWAPVQLAQRGLLHVLATDAHSSHFGRELRLSAAFDRLGRIAAMRPHLGWIAEDAPRAILAGEEVVAPFAAR